MTCENCIHSAARQRRKLHREKWEEDPRQPNPGGWKGFWNTFNYKDSDPYEDDMGSYLRDMDRDREIDNNTLILCNRFPVQETVHRTYECGEFTPQKES